jgi:integrase
MSNTPVEANRALACLRKLLSLASDDWELLEQNPARGISPFPEQKRERVPTDEELRKLGAWLAQVEADGSELPGCILAAKLMFFTAMRRGEVLGLEWSFAAAHKPDDEPIKKFIKRSGGINVCASSYAQYVRRLGKD